VTKKKMFKKAQPVARVIGSICFDILRAYTRPIPETKRKSMKSNGKFDGIAAAVSLMFLGR